MNNNYTIEKELLKKERRKLSTIIDKVEYLKQLKRLVIVVDMVNGFVKEGPLAAFNIMEVVPRQVEILEEAEKEEGTGICFIRDSHPINAEEFKVYGPHCIEGTKETEVIDELKRFQNGNIEYFKNSTNFMFARKFQSDLQQAKELERIDLMGCLSEVCVKNGAISLRTFLDEYNKDIQLGVYEDAIDTFDAPGHNAYEVTNNALKEMANNGIKVYKKGMK